MDGRRLSKPATRPIDGRRMELKLKCTPQANVIPATGQVRLVYALIEVDGGSPSGPLPLNLSLVIDCSDSMRIWMVTTEQFNELARIGRVVEVVTDGVPAWKVSDISNNFMEKLPRRLDYVKRALKVVGESIRTNDSYSLVAFAQQAVTVIPTTPGSERHRLAEAANQLDYLDLGNETEMADGIALAYELLQANCQPGAASRLVVLTDGYTRNANQCYAWANRAREKGISLSTMGIGNEFNEELLIPLADSTGGHAYFIEKPEQIPDVFQQELGAALSVTCRNLEVKLHLAQGVELRHVYRIRPSVAPLDPGTNDGGNYSVYLGDFEPSSPPALLLELILPPWQAGRHRAAQVMLACDNPDDAQARLTVREDLNITMADGADGKPTARIARIIEKVSAVNVGERALQEAEHGDVGNATIRLRQAATRMLDMGENDLGNQLLHQAQQLEKHGHLDPSATKRLRYETRRLGEINGKDND